MPIVIMEKDQHGAQYLGSPWRPSRSSTPVASFPSKSSLLTHEFFHTMRFSGRLARWAVALVVRSPLAYELGKIPIPIGSPEFKSTFRGYWQTHQRETRFALSFGRLHTPKSSPASITRSMPFSKARGRESLSDLVRCLSAMKVPCQGKGLTHCVRDHLLWDSRTSSMLPMRWYHTPRSD